ncbi:hypothetical protein LJC30_00915 [Odoribacter sp. OttesenSCG-928-L07]|nr:hypothetical protein [Odoribacter sp. OttesenSCG-928-L07]MDL2238978.1 hypothetical protein [Bacteroidales bacterium OttesenSCG-928-L14]MDL2240869.1 hypothetical protein [Bacteroidales bacterium OttesenSCG-928-K22]
MRKLILLLALPAIIFAGCVKQKNCEGCFTGSFVYFETPIYPDVGDDIDERFRDKKATAKFLPDDDCGLTSYPIFFTNTIPKDYRSKDTLRVCLTRVFSSELDFILPVTYEKLTCIEKID